MRGTAVANYRLTSTPSYKKLATIVENITDIFVRRDGRWIIFAEHESDSPKPGEPIVSGLPTGWKRTPSGKADRYLIYVDSEIKHGGQASASIITYSTIRRSIRQVRRKMGLRFKR